MKINSYCLMIVLAVLLLCPAGANARDYAVLVSAGEATADDTEVNSEYWYDLYLQYETLISEGYSHDDIYVLYGYGTPFPSSKPLYQNGFPFNIVDYSVNRANIQAVFSQLADAVENDDFLFVWWLGHGGVMGGHYSMFIETTWESVMDDEFQAWVDQITDYRTRAFSIMTCQSGAIIDELENVKTIVATACLEEEYAASDWLCDTIHTEMHYYERAAFHKATPGGLCGVIDADDNDDGRVSFAEEFDYIDDNMYWTAPQLSDPGGWAPDTYLSDDLVEGDVDGDGDVDLADLAALLASYGLCPGDPGYESAANFIEDDPCITLADLGALLGNYGFGV